MPRGVAVVRGGLAPLVDDETVRLHRRVEEDVHRGLGEYWRDTPAKKREGEGNGGVRVRVRVMVSMRLRVRVRDQG